MTTDTAIDLVEVTIDGRAAAVPKGTLIIRAAEQLGIHIPRFCDHPLLAPAGACRQCVVDVGMPGPDGSIRWMPKPQSSCTMTVTPGMIVKTQMTSDTVATAQRGVMELLLINHPLDCPVCDKGGECPLQNQAMSDGRCASRFVDTKRTYPKPVALTAQIMLDRERCILCQRCTRFAKEIAGDVFIDLQMRGARQQIGRFDADLLGFAGSASVPASEVDCDVSGGAFASYFSGNIIQICPVGALTSAAYRFRARPFDLRSVPAIAEHDANGAAIRVDVRRDKVLRRLAGNDPQVNEEWISDKDRFAFTWQTAADRLTTPLLRNGKGELVPVAWPIALAAAARGLAAGGAVLTGGRMPVEDAFTYSAFARVVLGTNDIDFRARPASGEEAAALASQVAGTGLGVTFASLEKAPQVLLVAFEPEDEGGIVFLRLRKAAAHGTKVTAIAPFASRGMQRIGAELLATVPGAEARTLAAIGNEPAMAQLASDLSQPGAVILVGERLATVPGGFTALLALAERSGAKVAWIPRRAGERGALEAGCLPMLLPGGRPVSDETARKQMEQRWKAQIPAQPGRSAPEIWAAAANGEIPALMVGGLQLADQVNQDQVRDALTKAFVVSLEVRASDVTAYADVVLPVAPPHERAGTFVNWEGRHRPFGQVLTTTALPEYRVLAMLADACGSPLQAQTLQEIHRDIDTWSGPRWVAADNAAAAPAATHAPAAGAAVLASWHLLLDAGSGQDGEPYLAATAQRPVARMSPQNVPGGGATVTISARGGSITLPLQVTDSMTPGVVWVPTNCAGSHLFASLGVIPGDLVQVEVK